MNSKLSELIKITVKPEVIEEECNPANKNFTFAYTIEIENLGSEKVQLLERHWVITSGGQPFEEVVGAGVVGKQPVLEQGEKFEYTSGAVIEDPVGSMHGSYTMRSENGTFFTVDIPKFDLLYMPYLH